MDSLEYKLPTEGKSKNVPATGPWGTPELSGLSELRVPFDTTSWLFSPQ